MTMRIVKLLIWAMAFSSGSALTSQDWRVISVLRSTRGDVERIIGAHEKSAGLVSTYETPAERIVVFYSGETCKDGTKGWKVPPNTVVSFTVFPNSKVKLSSLQLAETKFQREPDSHIQGAIHYINRYEGIRVETRIIESDEIVLSIHYEPSLNEHQLQCAPATRTSAPNASVPQRAADVHLPRKFDEYANISVRDETARVDNFATYLKNDPQLNGYVFIYPGPYTNSVEIKKRAKRLRDRLVKMHRVGVGRIVIMTGGCRDKIQVELYALPSMIAAPTPSPPSEAVRCSLVRE